MAIYDVEGNLLTCGNCAFFEVFVRRITMAKILQDDQMVNEAEEEPGVLVGHCCLIPSNQWSPLDQDNELMKRTGGMIGSTGFCSHHSNISMKETRRQNAQKHNLGIE